MKAYADDKINGKEKLKFVENFAGKGENVGNQHFLLFQQCFQKASFSRSLKAGLCGKGLTLYQTIPTFNDPKEEGFGKHSG